MIKYGEAALVGFMRLVAVIVLGGATATAALAQSDLPIPRFVSLGTGEANLRTGPGQRYPIEWVYVREGLPVEVVAQFDTWRRVRDWEGVEGWVHQRLLSGRRTVIQISDAIETLHAEPTDTSQPVARLEPGVIAELLACPAPSEGVGDWCYLSAGGHRGWMPRAVLWGVYTAEAVE